MLRGLLWWVLACSCAVAQATESDVRWQRSDVEAFAQARSEKRFVLLYLEAVWCHWCHVMNRETYHDRIVLDAIQANYVPLRIDQDARPDLASRYRDYGWPATIVFASDGTEIVKRQGYIAPEPMARLLAAIVQDPSPEAAGALKLDTHATPTRSGLAPALRDLLAKRHGNTHDTAHGGLATQQKYLDRDSVEYALTLAADGDGIERQRAIQTLDAARALIDPVWGGVYQYSTGGDWSHPHFEKLGALQGEYLRVYALAHAITGEKRYLDAALAIRSYIDIFLRNPEGGYFVSQDADLRPGEHSADYFALDDAARRARGMPHIDRSLYAREAGVIAEALAYLHEVSGDVAALRDARVAVTWAQRNRALAGGGFRHGERDAAGPYLADTLALGRALLQLHRSTGERAWLTQAAAAADFIDARFRATSGYASAARGNSPIAPAAQIDENIALARFGNALARYTGKPAHRDIAARALAYLAQEPVALARITEAGILLADREIGRDPLHLTVIGARDDAAAAALHAAALRVPAAYKRLEWWDRSDGPLPSADVAYPVLKRAAAFVCTERVCSTPIVRPQDVRAFVDDIDASH